MYLLTTCNKKEAYAWCEITKKEERLKIKSLLRKVIKG